MAGPMATESGLEIERLEDRYRLFSRTPTTDAEAVITEPGSRPSSVLHEGLMVWLW